MTYKPRPTKETTPDRKARKTARRSNYIYNKQLKAAKVSVKDEE